MTKPLWSSLSSILKENKEESKEKRDVKNTKRKKETNIKKQRAKNIIIFFIILDRVTLKNVRHLKN